MKQFIGRSIVVFAIALFIGMIVYSAIRNPGPALGVIGVFGFAGAVVWGLIASGWVDE